MLQAAGVVARRWSGLGAFVEDRWLELGMGGLMLVALAMAALAASLGLHPEVNLALAVVLFAMLAWSRVGVRAAIGEPGVARWARLLDLVQVKGTLAGVEIERGDRALPALADVAPEAHLVRVDTDRHVALPLADASCGAVVLGPQVGALDEATRATLLDEAVRVLHPEGHLVVVLPAAERRGWLDVPPVEWQPGSPPGWWSDALAERFQELRHAPLTRRLDVLLATRPGALLA